MKICTVEFMDGQSRQYFLAASTPPSNFNPLESETTVMLYGSKAWPAGEDPRWYYFPKVNVRSYSVKEAA